MQRPSYDAEASYEAEARCWSLQAWVHLRILFEQAASGFHGIKRLTRRRTSVSSICPKGAGKGICASLFSVTRQVLFLLLPLLIMEPL